MATLQRGGSGYVVSMPEEPRPEPRSATDMLSPRARELLALEFGLKEQFDDRYRRQALGAKLSLAEAPSAYIERNFWFTWITDHYGVRNRYDIGVDKMMWSSDYPHVGSNWPTSWRVIQAGMSGVPPHEREKMLAGNAQEIYRFGE